MRVVRLSYHNRLRVLREMSCMTLARNSAMAVLLGGSALGLGACSMTLPMGSLSEDTITTGSITPPRPAAQLSSKLSDEDWRRAQAALGLAVDPQGNGAPVSWDNPESGRKGSFVSAGPLYVLDDKVCRSFVATISEPGPDTQLQGSSCRQGPNEWVVREAKPWKQPG